MQSQCKPNAELENSFSKVLLRCSLTSRMQCQCQPNAERWELALKSYAEVQPDFANAKIQPQPSEIQFFLLPNIAPQKFSTPSKAHSALYLSAFRHVFHTQKKNEIGILSPINYQNVKIQHICPHFMPKHFRNPWLCTSAFLNLHKTHAVLCKFCTDFMQFLC